MILNKIVKENVHKCLIKSSTILSSEYEENSGDLLIIFKNGTQYKYYNVHEKDYLRFEISDSNGKVLNKFIKPFYECKRMDNLVEVDKDLYNNDNQNNLINE